MAFFLVVAFSALCYQFMIRPQLLMLNAVKKNFDTRSMLLQAYQTLPRHLSVREEKLNALADRASALEGSFCKREDAESLFARINGIALSSGVELVSVTPVEEKEISSAEGISLEGIRFLEVETEIVASGTYQGLINFLESLESGAPRIRLSNMKISAGESPEERRAEFALICCLLEKETD